MTNQLNQEETLEIKLKTGILPTIFIQDLVDNYHNNQLVYINENLGIEDAHSIWFDMETIKNFIAEIEVEAQRVDPNSGTQDLGIRFYYGAYSDSPADPIPEDYARRHTVVMIPTKKKDDGNGDMLDYDFNPFEETNTEMVAMSALALTPGALGQNHGRLIPPSTAIVESY